MKSCVFKRAVVLNAPIKVVYKFHENPFNMLAISPSWLAARVEEGHIQAVPGESFRVSVGLARIPFRILWIGFWRTVESPVLLVDETAKSPFAFWQHQHRFESIEGGRTRMTDHITYQFFGGWLGKLFGETLGRLQFRLMFADRHRRTQRWMDQQRTTSAS